MPELAEPRTAPWCARSGIIGINMRDNVSAMNNQHEFTAIIPAPFGAIGVRTKNDAIASVTFLPPDTDALEPKNGFAASAAEQIRQYLARPDFQFDLPVAENGTAFQQHVWRKINAIPPGKTASYGDIARLLRSAPRAVGQACGANPCPLFTPCHRVIRSGGAIGGFSGYLDGKHFMLGVKRWLLAHEGARFD